VGQTVTLNGWVNTYRNQGSLVFIDLRDRYGITQVVFEPDRKELLAAAQDLRSEFVIAVKGTVAARLAGKANKDLATGQIELKATELTILNRCPTPPFEITEFAPDDLANEDLRMQYRYLDLRRGSIQRTLMLRHRLCKVIRDYLDGQGFLELETPLLGRSTPEGARDYLVPSRIFPGQWFALPQSPQIYKQLLMVAGYDKYFQIARCLRDEDLRADRQPEFTQLDLEMSFVEMEDVFRVVEGLTAAIFKQCINVEIALPLPRLKYAEAMLRYGSDKPDLRYGLEIVDVGEVAAQSEFQVFRGTLEAGGKVRALNAKGVAEKFSRKGLDELAEVVKRCGAKGLAWIKVERTSSRRPSRNSCRPRCSNCCGKSWTPQRATCCSWSPTRKTRCARRWRRCASTWRRSSSCSIRHNRFTRSPGSTISRPLSGTRKSSAGPPTIIRSRRRWTRTWRGWRATRAASAPRRTTW